MKDLSFDKKGHPDFDSVIQAAYDEAKKQRATCEGNRWPGAEKPDRVLLWLDGFKSVGDVVANTDPVHLGLPWAGIRMISRVVAADGRQMSALASGMNIVVCIAYGLRAYITYLQRLPPALTTDIFRKALISLYVHVLRFLAEAIRTYSANPAARRLQALWRESDLAEFETKCHELGGTADIDANICDRDLQARGFAEAARWKDDLDVKLQRLDSIQSIKSSLDRLQIKIDLSKLFKVPEATYNSIAESKPPLCLDGTRSEILHDITQWASDPDAKLIFWLCGKAGTGKSTISRTVAED